MASGSTVAASNTATPLHGATLRRHHEPSMPELLSLYRRKYVGIDMVLKTVCYALRLRALYTTDPALKQLLDTNILNIIDCRMLCNSMKEVGTLRSGFQALATAREATDGMQHTLGILTAFSFFFRGIENFFGDLGYAQKNWFTHWDRMPISNKYKMFKTFSLLCCAMLEVLKLRRYFSAMFTRAWRAVHTTNRTVAGHIRRMSGVSPPPEVTNESQLQETQSIAGTPLSVTPDGSPTSFDPPKVSLPPTVGSAAIADSMGSPNGSMTLAPAQDIVALTRMPHVRSALFLLRNIADLIVYAQWIDAWRPYKTLEFSCGMLSGGLGILLVATDVVADATGRGGGGGV